MDVRTAPLPVHRRRRKRPFRSLASLARRLLGPTAMKQTALLIVVLCVASGCYNRSVRRAALVPHAQPTLRDGQPIDSGIAEASMGLATLMSASAPSEGDPNAGVYIPRIQANGALRFRPGNRFDIGLIYEHGFEKGSTAIAEDQPNPTGDAKGLGLSMGVSIPTGEPGLNVGLTGDFIIYSVPYIEYSTCIDCPTPYTNVEEFSEEVPVVSLGVIPSYRRGPWTVFGSLTMRNHPTTRRGEITTDDDDNSVDPGPFNAIVAAGASYTTPARVKLSMLVYQPVTTDPVEYAPTLAAAITIPFGSRPARRSAPWPPPGRSPGQ